MTFPSRSVTTRSSTVIVSYGTDDGVRQMRSSSMRPETLPAVPARGPCRASPSPRRARPASSPLRSCEHFLVGAVVGAATVQQPLEVVGDDRGVVGLGVVR